MIMLVYDAIHYLVTTTDIDVLWNIKINFYGLKTTTEEKVRLQLGSIMEFGHFCMSVQTSVTAKSTDSSSSF